MKSHAFDAGFPERIRFLLGKLSNTPSNPRPRLRLRVTATAETILRSGHPWLFADSVREQNRPGDTGELAVIFDRKDNFLAVGLYDADSPIRVRILHSGKPQNIDASFWQSLLARTLNIRQNLFNHETNGYRIINGESDGWPGLVLDRYAETLVLKIYTAAWLPRLEEIKALFCSQIPHETLVLRLSRNIQQISSSQFKLGDGQVLHGKPVDRSVVFLENGFRFEAEVLHGQKTGFFLDQRENRAIVETLSSGKTVLNAFSFSGGFSLYAARGGATSVTDLDISAHALESSKRNFALNQKIDYVKSCRHQLAQADVFEWLEKSATSTFDMIILDPPSLAKKEIERAGAIQAYAKLATLGLSRLNPRGILLCASCSAHVTAEEFFGAVRQAIRSAGRNFEEFQTTRHAPDHHASFKEAGYLKAIYLRC